MREWPHFCWEGLARDSKNGHPMEGVPSKGRSGRRGVVEGGVLGKQVGLLVQTVPLAWSHLQWQDCSFYCVAQWLPMCHPYGKGVVPVEKHQGNNFTDSAKLDIANTSWKVQSPSWAILAHSCSCLLSILIHWVLYLWSSFWASSLCSLSNWALAWLKFCRCWRAGL